MMKFPSEMAFANLMSTTSVFFSSLPSRLYSGALLDRLREGRGAERHISDLRGLAAVRVVGSARRARGGRGHGEDGQRGSAICQQVGCKIVHP